MDRMLSGLILLLALVYSAAASAQHDHHDEAHVKDGESVGVVDFRPDCAADSAETFNRGLALKHHMMYQQARETFRDLVEKDPDCAMAHWGVAATWFQPLWPERPDADALATGREAIERARKAGPGGEREHALIDAVGAFFADEDMGYGDRIDAWASGMAEAYSNHPEDHDIAALYALSRLVLGMRADTETRHELHDEAEAILAGVWEEENQHPGAIHYAIHATDVDGRAENALAMVEAYSDIAPSVPHALHMPSHIYVRLGEWDQVIEWNRRSADAARDHEVDDAISFHYIHALDYLVYGYLQKGEVDRAQAVQKEAEAVERHQPGFAAAFHAAAIPARIAVERRDWEKAGALEPRQPDYLPWDGSFWPEGLSWYARGLGAIHAGNGEAAQEAEARLATLRDRAKEAGEENFAIFIEVDRKILAGWSEHEQGNADSAIRLMEAAAELEGTVDKNPITPGALYPPYEALGDLLLALDRPDEALAAYQAGDDIWPGRKNTLAGMQQAREQLAN
ncbi:MULTISPECIES: tetratricopeptide repeat protein [Natronospira]|uniref:Tetratricopeptide repeat protein n=1 Tax=Natronospira bacteriovora TaxID=3069753 RepID=A0ABU0W8S5_9GAMM|nr:tetratricopeptide repeat protein [Natronospira sp. AB-CW4]MDQ2070313.1 tetratricopeptide repeat protein [Natronospira sp. AB-CW4]